MRVCVRARVWPTTRGPQTFSSVQVKRGDGVGRLGEEKEEREKKKNLAALSHGASSEPSGRQMCFMSRNTRCVYTGRAV